VNGKRQQADDRQRKPHSTSAMSAVLSAMFGKNGGNT
jgi:hypothetical protein